MTRVPERSGTASFLFGLLMTCLVATPAVAKDYDEVKIHQDDQGWQLRVNGEPTMVFGMNWSYIPVGKNYSWNIWAQPPEVIREVLDSEMSLLRDMGVNAIRQMPGVPPEWITYMYEEYGIFTVMNHFVARYGMIVDGSWRPNTDYSDPKTRAAVKAEIKEMIDGYRDTKGILMWMLGNENNYGLHWTSFEIEDLPEEQKDNAKAEPLYSLMGELIDQIQAEDPQRRPVGIANGDLGYIDLIVKHCKNMDVMGTNVYRGVSSTTLFKDVAEKLGIPVMYTEFGSDAFNAKLNREDPTMQAYYLHGLWQEIYEQSHGKGQVGNAIGGLIFQWSDGWWKHLQDSNLDIHDATATWENDAYRWDWVAGRNNMNEEWFGIAAKDFPDERGVFKVRPRSAYYLLRDAFKLDPYAEDTTPERIKEHFGQLSPRSYLITYEGDKAAGKVEELERLRVSQLRLELESYITAGSEETERGTPKVVDHMQSFYIGLETRPTERVRGELVLNILGNVPTNRLDEIFYENRGERRQFLDEDGDPTTLEGVERVSVYSAEIEVQEKLFVLEGFYRVGHYHWGYEGDFFGFYPEAHYGPNLDIYNGKAPSGAEVEFKQQLKGLKLAIGPELWWGANPAVLAKWRKTHGPFTYTIIHHEDLAENADSESSVATPEQQTRRSSIALEYEAANWTLTLGGIFAGSERVGRSFQWVRETDERGYLDTDYEIINDEIAWADTLGGKAKFTLTEGRYNWFVQGGLQGLVASGGGDWTKTFAGWMTKPSGRGNQWHAQTGLLVHAQPFQFGPNVMFQKPLIGPNPVIPDHFSDQTGIYYRGFGPRNVRDDPFVVLENREQIASEFLIVYDPTPATWIFAWNNDEMEDAPFAAAVHLMYRKRFTRRDASMFVSDSGAFLPFGDSPPQHDLAGFVARFVSSPGGGWRLRGTLGAGEGEPNGPDTRKIRYGGAGITATWRGWRTESLVIIDGWGPYDYHRDFNQTYPFQLYTDVSWGVLSRYFDEYYARMGLRYQHRTLDEHSPGLALDADEIPSDISGSEWEFGTYLHVGM
jgi:hypothetical protein